ncbi:SGNH/GDSL hydrolase family protein [Bordetella avium]|uniref:Cellulose biosynthesis protein n=1 Tax=Bordetella avium (strain 197N) TaxID=360910 RepID=Q2KWR8_BORA1|nr:SGNH/GDSL hydrolase family protein [Bordetella avium]AZY49968.1 SGNH/GDSL hydrolase family protein [Bordetella avium]AZY53334.1 SGNH/GDSL hydrolase family protein [Bordetella avium]RIQ13073.1 SGNH/GDSL hydrolase family protein [Bordetella avium]RIQ17325.1 SGNH/GDSL hydrolase family protein [Bordetella avium]RIQ33810.1 SGNH/GDSL hydrolase family protein [Bordetella avium]
MLASLFTGLSILLVGDSHLAAPDYLITTLQDDLVKQGAQVQTIGVCGSNAGDWLKTTPGNCGGAVRTNAGPVQLKGKDAQTTPITELIAKQKPQLVVIVLGDTMAGYSNASFPKTWAWQQTTALTKAIAGTGTACVWVGPGWGTEGGKYNKNFARVKQMSAFLASNVAPCAYIDSTQFSKPGAWATTDGQHYTAAGYKAWGDAIAKQLTTLPVVQALQKKP